MVKKVGITNSMLQTLDLREVKMTTFRTKKTEI